MAAKYNSATSIQHIYKQESVTLTAEAQVANGSGGITLLTSDGQSKLAYMEKTGTGKYLVFWELPVQTTLGSPCINVMNAASGAGDLYSVQILSKEASWNGNAGIGYQFQVYHLSGSTQAQPENPPQGAKLLAHILASTSPVF